MAVLTAERISSVALALLARKLVIPAIGTRVPPAELGPPSRGKVIVRVRAPRTGAVQDDPGDDLTYTPLDEVPVTLNVSRVHDGTTISDWDLSLSIEDYARQVTEPQVAAVAARCETICAEMLNNLDTNLEVDPTPEQRDAYAKLLAARAMLSTRDVPPGDRWCVASPSFINLLLEDDRVVRADASGSPSALRDATVGRVAGFTVVESAALTDGTAVAMHRSALVVGTRAPAPTDGAGDSSTMVADGLELNVTHDWDSTKGADISLVSTFFGAGLVYEDGEDATDLARAVKLDAGTGSG